MLLNVDHNLIQIARFLWVDPCRDDFSHLQLSYCRRGDRKHFIHFIGFHPHHADLQTYRNECEQCTSASARDMSREPEDGRFPLPAGCFERLYFLFSLLRVPDEHPIQRANNRRHHEQANANRGNNCNQRGGCIHSYYIASGSSNCPLIILRFYTDHASQRVHFQRPCAADRELLEFGDAVR